MRGRKCRVCGKYIRGVYTHYGVQSCSACANFFIRAYTRKYDYACDNQNMCLALPSRRGSNCRKCRLQKCLDIGMRSTTFANSGYGNNEQQFAEYLNLAKKLYGLLAVITNYPQLLLNYYFNDDNKLLASSNQIALHAPDYPYIRSWAKLFKKNQIPFAEMHILFYSIVSNIKFPWLPQSDQDMISSYQRDAIKKYLQTSTYSNKEIKEGFDKITAFFEKQHYKFFASAKLPPTAPSC
uniref:Nuclear receptor domain-containing protein n=1 Tax=Panagrolaimus sp. ES5 TaxID=591445 RepID=A0AC34G714_9BILA